MFHLLLIQNYKKKIKYTFIIIHEVNCLLKLAISVLEVNFYVIIDSKECSSNKLYHSYYFIV